jgi:drug/metabolite transporter (DMT)-like permease
MSWQVVMLLQNVFAAIFALLSRRLTLKYPKAHFQILTLIFVVLYAVGLGYVAFTGQHVITALFVPYWWRYIGGGMLFGVWTYFSYRVFSYVDAAIASLLATLNIVAVVITSSLLIHEGLTLRELLGAVVLLAAMLIVLSARVSKLVRTAWGKGIGLSLLASSVYGFAIANEKWLLSRVGIPTYVVFGFGWQLVPLLLFSLIIGRSQYHNLRKPDFLKSVGLTGLMRGAAGLLFIISLVKSNNASLVSVLSGFKVVLTAIWAAIILHERKLLGRKLVASLLAMLGIAVMLWK